MEAVKMWLYRRMMRLPWTDKKLNEDIPKENNSQKELITHKRQTQPKFYGHVMRREQLEFVMTTGKLEGSRGKRRPR